MGSERLRAAMAWTVLAVWAVIALSTVYTNDFTTLGIITPIMTIASGYVFGFKVERRKMNGKEES